MPVIENNKEMVPFEHYAALYAKLDPAEASERCGVRYDPVTQSFGMRLLYVDYELTWPAFSIRSKDETGFALNNLPAQMLLMRYLLEGKRSVGTGQFLPYREMPWGEVYLKPFTGRCLNRAAFTFGTRLSAFERAMEDSPAIKLGKGDAAYQIEVMPGYDIRLIVWEGDDEFPPNSQILFSDNFPQAFSAEDRTVVGDIVISDIKRKMA
ncbi:MAG: DUF3786 domain-containing protein [Clostridia bacterium]|nr:DUF3786 domain-containing protein [Clostridia bacterium]